MIGTLIADKYELLGELGNSSGLGLTYKARHAEDGRLMAVKVVSVPGDDVNLKRYEQGIASARLLNHPNIVGIIDSGVTEKGSPFYVTDFVEGRTLGQILRESKRMPVSRVVPLVAQICDALDHAHYYGVIHRNLTPDNIIVRANPDGTEMVHVLDFGLAKSFFAANKPDHKLTNAGDIIGNPEYLSPEQCMWKEADWRSDIYSLGCLTYHMLAGKPPFRGSSKLDTLVKQAKEAPVDLIEAAGADAAIPPAVRDVVMRALEKDPNARQQTMIILRDEFVQSCSMDSTQDVLRKAAEAGDRNAQFELGSYLEKCNTTQNIAEIAEWFQKAADQGHPDAQFRMGQAYELGLGVKRDAARAIEYYQGAAEGGRDDARLRWLNLAANEGDVNAQVNIALMFIAGSMVPQNLAEAEKWLGKAAQGRFAGCTRIEEVTKFAFSLANRDHPEGCYWLGIIYKDGCGTPVDELTSAKWLIKAVDAGHATAQQELDSLPGHIVDKARRGRPRWDHRKTALPHELGEHSKQLIAALRDLAKKDTLTHRFDLYESIRGASLLVCYEDRELTTLAAVEDADGEPAAVAFTDFAAFNKWQEYVGKQSPFSERVGHELCLELTKISEDMSLVINPSSEPGITLRNWELRALASSAYPVERGVFLTEFTLSDHTCYARVPPRPGAALFDQVVALADSVKWIKAVFLIEAVFEPVENPPLMTAVVQLSGNAVPKDMKRVEESLLDAMMESLDTDWVHVVFAPDGVSLAEVRRKSVCLFQRK